MRAVRFVVVLALCALLTSVAFAASANTYTGWVMDQKCAKAGKTPNADCAKACIKSGEAMVLVNDADKNLLTVSNPKSLESHIGQHVKVQGTVENDKITVTSAEAMPAKAGQ